MLPDTGTHTARSILDEMAAPDPSPQSGSQPLAVLADVVERFAAAWLSADDPPELEP